MAEEIDNDRHKLWTMEHLRQNFIQFAWRLFMSLISVYSDIKSRQLGETFFRNVCSSFQDWQTKQQKLIFDVGFLSKRAILPSIDFSTNVLAGNSRLSDPFIVRVQLEVLP